ncbi:hypothetical protein [Nonomuraea longicatena]|uniref:SCO6045-like C-terminal domain-containing protein n=1 Tax=Nonomuraea longicatena TaxID=83682 RepID=A0ABN1QYS6_9ACTN
MDDARRRLGAAQEELLSALVAGGEPPEGFDPERLRIQSASLVSKRREVVARLRPDAATAAGGALAAEFAAYARSRERPPPGYRSDADDFAAWLRVRGLMPDPGPHRRWRDLSPGSRWRELLPRFRGWRDRLLRRRDTS